MATLLIPSEALASWLETDLEGRLEVMDDDNLKGSPDYTDADSVAQALRDATSFPAIIEMSDAEAVQASIAVENFLDFADETDPLDDGKTALAHLQQQGITERA